MRLGGTKTIVSWKQKLALRLMGITHDINKLSQDFIRAKSINNPSTDFHAVQIMESRFLNKRFWETTGNIPLFRFDLPSPLPLWYLVLSHHTKNNDEFLRTFQRAEVYTTAMSSYAVPYGRKQLDNIIVFNNIIWTGQGLEKLRWEIFQRLPIIEETNMPSEEEARYLYYNLEAVICLLKQVPADTRELSISYAEHIRNIEQYFQGIVNPVNAVQLQTYRTLLTVGSSFQSLLAGFTDFFLSLQYHYRTFLEEHIRKIEKHCQNVKDEQCFQRLRLLNTEKTFLDDLQTKGSYYSTDELFCFFKDFYQQEKPKSLYTIAADLLATYKLCNGNLSDTLVHSGFLVKTKVCTFNGVYNGCEVKDALLLELSSHSLKLPKRLLLLMSAVSNTQHSELDIPYKDQFLTPIPFLKKGETIALHVPERWLLGFQNCEGKEPKAE